MIANETLWDRLALIKLYQLAPEVQSEVREHLDSLARMPISTWPLGTIRPLPADSALSLVHIDNSLRAIVVVENDRLVQILDVVRQETLDAFRRALVGAKN